VNTLKKYEFTLNGLDCANCAREIEEGLQEIEGLENVVVNFAKLKLSYETDTVNKEDVIKKVLEIEPEVEVEEINKNSAKEKSTEKEENISKTKMQVLRLIIGAAIAGIGLYLEKFENMQILSMIVVLVGYIILLYRTLKNAAKLLIKSHSINENFLVSVSCIGAYFVGEHFEGLMVIVLYEIGKILEEKAINKTRKSISDLMDIKPEYANLKVGDEAKVVSPEEVKIDDIVIIKNGEKIPLDGIVVSGEASLNTASLTGESKLRKVKVGDEVLSGSINEEGLLEIKVTSEYENSTVQKIIDLVENATDKKAKTETFVNKAAKIYTPIVILLAVLVAVFLPMISGVTYTESVYRALIFLVISCPCAIAISVPLSYFSGIGKASKVGILIKGSDYIDSVKDLKEVVFDKTGTLTKGEFSVEKIKNISASKYSDDEILNYAVLGESFSNHPIAKSILKSAKSEIDTSKVTEYKEIAGKGISYKIDGKKVFVGNKDLMSEENDNSNFVENLEKEEVAGATNIFVRVDNEPVGIIVLADTVKAGVKEAIQSLNKMGIKTRMFTGDNLEVAKKVAKELNIDSVKAEMLPTDKYGEMEKIIKNRDEKSKVAFVGDGINDSPVLALADVGFSMGGVGSSSAIEASDIVIMTDDIQKIVDAIQISKNTCKIIKQNLIFAVFVKILVLILSSVGILGMASAVFADVGVTLITIFNTIRILK
jgi:Cd2+/Zn2+-exporting ATPase